MGGLVSFAVSMSIRETLIIFGAEYLVFLQALATLVLVWIRRRLFRPLVGYAFMSGFLSFILSRLSNWSYNNPRPFVEGGFTPFVAHSADNGFPSDHALFAAWLAAVVYPLHRPTGMVLIVIAILVGVSRVAAGVHHVEDVVASFLIVLVSALIAGGLQLRYGKKKASPAR